MNLPNRNRDRLGNRFGSLAHAISAKGLRWLVTLSAALSRRRSESEGPQGTQAGIENFRSTTLARGFYHHPRAWARRAVRFYHHEQVI